MTRLDVTRIVGREKEREALLGMIRAERFPQSMLIRSIPGAGKLRLALWAAGALLCHERSACGTCDSCRRAGALLHGDLHLFLPHGSPGAGSPEHQHEAIEQMRGDALQDLRANRLYGPPPPEAGYYVSTIRNIRKVAQMKSGTPGGAAVFVIADADRMASSAEAQNAFLKLLEEPPDHTFFILSASAPELLLDTVLSRLRLFALPPIPEPELTHVLVDGGIDVGQAEVAARLSGGSAEKALDSLMPEWRTERERASRLLLASIEGDQGEIIQAVSAMGHGAAAAQMTPLLSHLQEAIHEAARGNPNETLRNATRLPTIAAWAEALHVVSRIRETVRINGSPQLQTHTLLSRLEEVFAA